VRYAYNPAYHHPVSHILPTEHVSPPPAEILGSAPVAGGPGTERIVRRGFGGKDP
jgi:hypothetical protein